MLLSGFSFIRNGNKLNYPFTESVKSILPVCDEFVVTVGNSEDGTRESILAIDSPKIKILDTVWDEGLREDGKILAQQTNMALDAIQGTWGFYLQGDEVIHEKDWDKIVAAANKYKDDKNIDGLLFSYLHFYGNYNYIKDRYSKRIYPLEIRIVRNDKHIRSFRDAQGFRKYSSPEQYNSDKGRKLNVVKIGATVYHYGMVRNPEMELERQKDFNKLWHSDEWVNQKFAELENYEHNSDVPLEPFTGSHPAVMVQRIKEQNWNFIYKPELVKEPLKYSLQRQLQKLSGRRFFDYENYKVIGTEY